MSQRILLVGSGGREHALAWKILQSPLCARLVVAPGNPGVAALAAPGALGAGKLVCAPIASDRIEDLLALAAEERIDFVVCGPEGPLTLGLGDAFAARGVRFFGPSRAAAEIEGSKAFAKSLMKQVGVPTAAFATFSDSAEAAAFIRAQPGDVVVKADGLCAGKGVTVTSSHDEAVAVVRTMLHERSLGEAGARVVIEERLIGREVSMMALCDGTRFTLLASAEDHKAVHDGDQGPNTGGMGAYSPSPLIDDALEERIGSLIFAPVIRALADAGRPFRGLLYGGLILTADRGPMVIEWNCRFGDPETQAVIARLDEDLVPWLLAAADGALPGGRPRWTPGVGVCVVLAAEGYPGKVRSGDRITGLRTDGQLDAEAVAVFHAGTSRGEGESAFVTGGGRVLGITAVGPTLETSRARVYAAIDGVRWPGMHFRKDIGLRGKA